MLRNRSVRAALLFTAGNARLLLFTQKPLRTDRRTSPVRTAQFVAGRPFDPEWGGGAGVDVPQAL